MTSIVHSWGRLTTLLAFYRALIGTGGILRMVMSGLAVSLIELGGLALVFPFLTLATDMEASARLARWASGTAVSGFLEEHHRAVSSLGLIIALIYIGRGWLTSRLLRYQAMVAARINSLTSDSVISSALASRYQLFVEHSPVKVAGLSYSNTTHAALLFQSMLSGFNEATLLAIVVGGVLLTNPTAFLFFAIAATVLTLALFRPLSRRVAQIGQRSQEVDLGRHRFVFAMANAIRDIKIMGLENPFSARNRELASRHAALAADYSSIAALQRIAVEVVLVCGIVIAAIWYSLDPSDLNQSAPLIATLGLIVMRAAPALSRMAGAYNGFRYSLPFVENLLVMQHQLDQYPQRRVDQTADFPGEYSAVGLCFSYGQRQVLRDCTLSIQPGEVVVIVGPSGAGKSTLLDLLAGLQPPSSGRFSLGGISFSPFLSSRFPARVGYVPQSIAIFDGSIQFNIALEQAPDPERLRRAISRAMLVDLIASLPDGLDTLIGDGGQGLSGGQRQRLGIARALYREPALLILDEVTSALDNETAQSIIRELLTNRARVSMLFVTHDPKLIPADRTYLLDQGCLTLQPAVSR